MFRSQTFAPKNTHGVLCLGWILGSLWICWFGLFPTRTQNRGYFWVQMSVRSTWTNKKLFIFFLHKVHKISHWFYSLSYTFASKLGFFVEFKNLLILRLNLNKRNTCLMPKPTYIHCFEEFLLISRDYKLFELESWKSWWYVDFWHCMLLEVQHPWDLKH